MTSKNTCAAAAAIAMIAKGKGEVTKGKGKLISALVPMVKDGNIYSAKAGETGFTFKLAEYSRPVFHEGELIKGQQGAKFAAFCEAHGIEPNQALMSDFVKCLDSAIAIALGSSGATIAASGIISLPLGMCKGINLGDSAKPSQTFNKLAQQINFGRKRKLEGEALIAAIKGEMVECNGSAFFAGGKAPKQDQAILALQQLAQAEGLIPTKATRNTRKGNDVDDTRQALVTVNKALIAITRSDESPIGLTSKDETVLREIAQNIAAYFAN